jgi:hypothetical protein
MRDNKDFDESKLEAAEIKLNSSNKALGWLENFWYYHKWKVIVILFFAIVFAVGISQMINKEEPDANVVVAAPIYFYAERIEGLEATLEALIPRGGEDGAKNLNLYTYSIYSEDEMKAANEAETDDEGKYVGTLRNDDMFQYFLKNGDFNLNIAENTSVCDIFNPSYSKPLKHDSSIKELIECVKEHNFVPIVDDRGCFIGIILRREILNYLLSYIKDFD